MQFQGEGEGVAFGRGSLFFPSAGIQNLQFTDVHRILGILLLIVLSGEFLDHFFTQKRMSTEQ